MMEALKQEKEQPRFLDGLQYAYLLFDVSTTIDKMRSVLTTEEKLRLFLLTIRN